MDDDELGRVIARRDSAGHVKASYVYDVSGTLTKVNGTLDHVTPYGAVADRVQVRMRESGLLRGMRAALSEEVDDDVEEAGAGVQPGRTGVCGARR